MAKTRGSRYPRKDGLGFSSPKPQPPSANAVGGSRSDLDAQEHKALQLLHRGHIQDAETILRNLLARGAGSSRVALNLAGLCARSGRIEEALQLLLDALHSDPNYAAAHYNLAQLYRAQGDLKGAVSSYRRVLELDPSFPGVAPALGQVFLELDDQEFSIASLQEITSAHHPHPELCFALGNALLIKQQFSAAESAYKKALSAKPNFPEAHCNLGNVYFETGDLASATECFLASLSLLPHFVEAQFNLANTFRKQGALADAIEAYRATLRVKPDHTLAWLNLGNVFRDSGDCEGALNAYRAAISYQPDSAQAHSNLGATLQESGHTAEAITAFRAALSLQPDFPEALCNLANALEETGEVEAAIDTFRQALLVQSDYADAHFQLGLALLKSGDYPCGWEQYEWRLRRSESKGERLHSSRPVWQPGCRGRVLLWGEQGVGDEIMFASQIPQLYALCDHLIVATDKRLLPLFKRSFPADIVYHPRDQPFRDDDYDYHVAMGSLGRILRRKPMAFAASAGGYLVPDAEQVTSVRTHLQAGRQVKLVGLSWHSSVKRSKPRQKSIPLRELALALRHQDYGFVSLQYGDTDLETAALKDELGVSIDTSSGIDLLSDLDGLASLVCACDDIVTISNVTAHLAGALGKKTTLLVPFSCDWRWGMAGSTTNWYESISILRQQTPGDWSHPLQQLVGLSSGSKT
jgi:tetratricopeptide (TPR) repeat protein